MLLLLLRSCVSRRLARPYLRVCHSLARWVGVCLLTTAYLVFDSLHPGLSPSVARVGVSVVVVVVSPCHCLFIPALPRSDIYLLRWLRALDYYIQRRIIYYNYKRAATAAATPTC